MGRPTAAVHLGPEASVRTVEEERAEPAALRTSPTRRDTDGKPRYLYTACHNVLVPRTSFRATPKGLDAALTLHRYELDKHYLRNLSPSRPARNQSNFEITVHVPEDKIW